AKSRQKDQTVSLERELPDIRDRNEHLISLGRSAEGVWTHQNTVRHPYVCTSAQGSTRQWDNPSTALRTTGTSGIGRASSCQRCWRRRRALRRTVSLMSRPDRARRQTSRCPSAG